MKYDSNGFNIGYTKFTAAGSEDVLFIHGNLASKEWWEPTMETLNSQPGPGTLIAADWRGYGDSKGISDINEINFETFACDFVSLLQAEGLDNVTVVGHSTGGLIAMLAVLQKPELFKSLVLLDSVGATGLDLELPKEQVLSHFQTMGENRDYCMATLAATIKGCDLQSSTFQRLFEITWSGDRAMYTGVIEVLSEQIDIRDQMKNITLPTLILHGDEDVVLPLSLAETLHAQLPNSTLRVMTGQGHSMNMENPERLFQELKSFWSAQAEA